jgi:hypothetical protein
MNAPPIGDREWAIALLLALLIVVAFVALGQFAWLGI